jgi:hypothetical protein
MKDHILYCESLWLQSKKEGPNSPSKHLYDLRCKGLFELFINKLHQIKE